MRPRGEEAGGSGHRYSALDGCHTLGSDALIGCHTTARMVDVNSVTKHWMVVTPRLAALDGSYIPAAAHWMAAAPHAVHWLLVTPAVTQWMVVTPRHSATSCPCAGAVWWRRRQRRAGGGRLAMASTRGLPVIVSGGGGGGGGGCGGGGGGGGGRGLAGCQPGWKAPLQLHQTSSLPPSRLTPPGRPPPPRSQPHAPPRSSAPL